MILQLIAEIAQGYLFIIFIRVIQFLLIAKIVWKKVNLKTPHPV